MGLASRWSVHEATVEPVERGNQGLYHEGLERVPGFETKEGEVSTSIVYICQCGGEFGNSWVNYSSHTSENEAKEELDKWIQWKPDHKWRIIRVTTTETREVVG